MYESGLIIDMGRYTVTVLTRDNGYYKIFRKPTMYVSQQIQFKRTDAINVLNFARKSPVVAAAAILVIFAVLLYSYLINDKSTFVSENIAYISLDTNISVQFTINGDDRVVDLEFKGNDSKKLLGKWEPQGMKIEDAVNNTVKKCSEKEINKINRKTYFLLSGTFSPDDEMKKDELTLADKRVTTILAKLKKNIDSMSPGENETFIVKCNPYEKESAAKNNISLGRYALYSELYKSADRISIEDVKNFTVSDLLSAYRKIKPEAFITNTPISSVTPDIKEETFTYSSENMQTPRPTKIQSSTVTPYTDSGKEQGSNKKANVTPGIVSSSSPTPFEKGTGLRGEYYDNIDLTNLKLIRIDSLINFVEWTDINPPANAIRNDASYSMRWTGFIEPPQAGEYKFYVTRDNGVRLWIDNKLIIDKWNSDWNITDSGTISLEGGKKYDIKIEYFNNAGIGTMILEWSSSHISRTVVPTSYLFPPTTLVPYVKTIPGYGTGLTSEYFDNPDFTSLKVTGTDPEIYFHWGVGSPDLAINADQKFSIRWAGYVQPLYSEDYIFYLTHDDGIRLWINGNLEIDKWKTGFFYSETRKISLKAGQKYSIKLEYFNDTINGEVTLEWNSPSTKRSVVPMSRLFPLN